MTIKQQGGVFGRNPTFNDVAIGGELSVSGEVASGTNRISGDLFINDSTPTIRLMDTDVSYFSQVRQVTGSMIIENDTANLVPNTTIVFRVDGAEAVKIDSNKNLVIANAGSGIDFSATSGTGTSELFDDYEEGTWTPVISDANSGGNLGSAAISDATYTKIGRTVVLNASLSNIDTTGMTSTAVLYIQGLPFTSSAGTYAVGNVKVDTVTFPGSRTYIYCQIGGNQAFLNFQVGASAVAEDNVDVQHISSGVSDIQFSITYTAA